MEILGLNLQEVGDSNNEVVYLLARNIKPMPSVQQLTLSCCPKKDASIPYLGDLLGAMPNLQFLSLRTASVICRLNAVSPLRPSATWKLCRSHSIGVDRHC